MAFKIGVENIAAGTSRLKITGSRSWTIVDSFGIGRHFL
jgi:hypothetical protein